MIRMMHAALGAGLTMVLQPAFAEPTVDVQTRCFQFADHPDKLLRLRLIATQDGNEAAFVRYAGARAWIPLVLTGRKSITMADGDREQIDTEWAEIVHNHVAGHYALSMMGNEVNSFEYVDPRTLQKTAFTLAPTPRGVDPCDAR